MGCLGSLCYLCSLSVNLTSFYKVFIKNVLNYLFILTTPGLCLPHVGFSLVTASRILLFSRILGASLVADYGLWGV